jgi:hypothetical protein
MSFNRPSALIGVAATAVTAAASYWIYQAVSQYGWNGTIWYVWEGKPYSPRVRESMETLEQAGRSLRVLENLIDAIEEYFSKHDAAASERACLDSIDDAALTEEIGRLWMADFSPPTLETTLIKLIYTIDKLAAKVDGVLAAVEDGGENSRGQQDLKRWKKVLSKQIVLAMQRADTLFAFINNALLQETQ